MPARRALSAALLSAAVLLAQPALANAPAPAPMTEQEARTLLKRALDATQATGQENYARLTFKVLDQAAIQLAGFSKRAVLKSDRPELFKNEGALCTAKVRTDDARRMTMKWLGLPAPLASEGEWLCAAHQAGEPAESDIMITKVTRMERRGRCMVLACDLEMPEGGEVRNGLEVLACRSRTSPFGWVFESIGLKLDD